MQDAQAFIQAIRESEDHLEHHGIKGQKWGVRRFQNPDGTRIGAKKRKKNREQEKASKEEARKTNANYTVYSEKAKTLSDDELKKRNVRMENELKYKRYQDTISPDKAKARKALLKKIFVDSAINAASQVMTSVYTDMGKKFLEGIGIMRSNSKDNGGNKEKKSDNSTKNNNDNKDSDDVDSRLSKMKSELDDGSYPSGNRRGLKDNSSGDVDKLEKSVQKRLAKAKKKINKK